MKPRRQGASTFRKRRLDALRRLDENARETYPSLMAETRRTVERGRYYEDFKVGDLYRHHWGRTLTDGEAQLFATATMNAVPLYFNKLHAQALGHPAPPVHPLLVMNVVFGMTVEDLSEQAIAHLGYWNMTFPRFVYPGDTLASSSEVLDKREPEASPTAASSTCALRVRTNAAKTSASTSAQILVKKRAFHQGASPRRGGK